MILLLFMACQSPWSTNSVFKMSSIQIEPKLQAGKNIMIAAHGNSLRSIIMYLDSLTSQEVNKAYYRCIPGVGIYTFYTKDIGTFFWLILS